MGNCGSVINCFKEPDVPDARDAVLSGQKSSKNQKQRGSYLPHENPNNEPFIEEKQQLEITDDLPPKNQLQRQRSQSPQTSDGGSSSGGQVKRANTSGGIQSFKKQREEKEWKPVSLAQLVREQRKKALEKRRN